MAGTVCPALHNVFVGPTSVRDIQKRAQVQHAEIRKFQESLVPPEEVLPRAADVMITTLNSERKYIVQHERSLPTHLSARLLDELELPKEGRS